MTERVKVERTTKIDRCQCGREATMRLSVRMATKPTYLHVGLCQVCARTLADRLAMLAA